MTEWKDRITVNANICHGVAVISGTRIPVSVVLDNLADGMDPGEFVASYPNLTVEDVHAAVAYGAELARD